MIHVSPAMSPDLQTCLPDNQLASTPLCGWKMICKAVPSPGRSETPALQPQGFLIGLVWANIQPWTETCAVISQMGRIVVLYEMRLIISAQAALHKVGEIAANLDLA